MKKLYFLLCLLLFPLSVSAQQYSITNYYIDVTVNENNIYDITEYYNLLFIEDSEFSRTIQLRPKVHLSNGKFITYVTEVSNVASSETTFVKKTSKIYNVTFPKSTNNTNKAISLEYQYNMGNDLDDTYDVVFVNIADGTIETITDTSTFSVTLPCVIEKENIKFYQNGEQLDDSKVDYVILGNHIEGTINYKINQGDTIAIQILLPENTFQNIVRTDSNTSYFLIIVPIIMLVCGLLALKKYKKQKIQRVENPFEIEKVFDSVEMAYLYKGEVNAADLLSLLFKLANDGYISLKNFGSKDKVTFKVKKEREYDKDNAAQKILFDGLFQNKEEVDIHGIEGVFYPYYIDAKRTLQNDRNKSKVFYMSKKIKILLRIGIYIGLTLLQIKPLYNLFDSYVFGIIASVISSAILVVTYQPKSNLIKYILLALSGIIIAIEGYALLDFKLDFCIYCIAMILLEMTLIIESLIPLRTIYGNQIYYEIDAFRLELASMSDETFDEKMRENPNYFFDMIPYTIVFDLTSWWFERFQNKVNTIPSWYQSSETYDKEKLLEFIKEVIIQLAIPIQTNRMYTDELLNQAQNKLL